MAAKGKSPVFRSGNSAENLSFKLSPNQAKKVQKVLREGSVASTKRNTSGRSTRSGTRSGSRPQPA